MFDDEKTTAVQQPLYQNVLVEDIPDLPCMSLTECGSESTQEMEKVRLWTRSVSDSVAHYILRDTGTWEMWWISAAESQMESDLSIGEDASLRRHREV